MGRDTIFQLPREQVGQFEFDESVVRVFPDMISRSVPGYASILSMIEQLTARFAQPHSNLYDLGCSLGAATRLMRRQAPSSCTIHAVDSSQAMFDRLVDLLSDDAGEQCKVATHLSDIRHFPLHNASFVVLNFVLQFVPLSDRQGLLNQICQSLQPGGGFLISEKLRFEDGYQQQLLTELHHDFKRANGYSDLEIAQKRTAIENVLIPETLTVHCQRLRQAGFEQVVPWFQCFNFASILAVKAA
jgi:tRNA (cmo5U34)-methyltransferase